MDLQIIQNKIFEVRGYRVMLDLHLAELYQVETRALKQAVKRNIDRFPSDFMFELSKDEWLGLITNCDKFPDNIRHTPTPPMAFTEQGVAMLSSVLRSKVAIEVNISIMRAFVLMRQMVIGYEELLKRIEELEVSTDAQFNELYQALTQLLSQSKQQKERRPVGFVTYERSGNRTGNDFGNEIPPNKLYPNKVHSFTLRAVHRLPAFFISFSHWHIPRNASRAWHG